MDVTTASSTMQPKQPQRRWNSTSPLEWAQVLGLACAPLFRAHRHQHHNSTHTVLLDGKNASFSLYSGDVGSLIADNKDTSWSWSAHLRCAAMIDPERQVVLLRKWDE